MMYNDNNDSSEALWTGESSPDVIFQSFNEGEEVVDMTVDGAPITDADTPAGTSGLMVRKIVT